MPNHISTDLNASPEVIRALVNAEGEIDFNNIVPMPPEEEANWYSWSCENWGTKWNAYETYADPEAGFASWQSAWAVAMPAMLALSEKFPEEELQLQWADEDFGSNVGRVVLKNGDFIVEDIPDDHSKEAMEMAMEILGGEEDWIWDEESGEYMYYEDYEELEQTRKEKDEKNGLYGG